VNRYNIRIRKLLNQECSIILIIFQKQKALSWAEEKALEHHVNVELGKIETDPEPVYVNAKKLGKTAKPDPFSIPIDLKQDQRFKTEVNFNYSAVHVPSSIYDKSNKIYLLT